jgi:phosphatidylinositol alpha-1,6-mannosyltransferase
MMGRVLYLSPGVFDKGGISRYARFQLRALRELCGPSAVTVLSLLPPDAHGFEQAFPVDFASFGPTAPGKALFAAAAALAAAGDRPSVVWSGHVGIGPLGLAIARAAGATSVLNIYGLEVWTRLRRLPALALRRTDHVISDCHNTAQYAFDHDLRAPERTVVHWDCVDVARFAPLPPASEEREVVLARYGVPPAAGRFTVLTLGRMAPDTIHKGYDRLIDVFARIPRDIPIRLILGGDGARRAALEARARGQEDRVIFAGRVHDDDLPAFYRAADAFSLITDFGPGRGEGIPLTPLEAAACGKPILVGNQDGSREAAEDGVSGFVLDPFDLDAIADRLLRLARDPALGKRMGEAARGRIEREHSFERFRARTAALLGEIAPSASAR